MPERYADRQVLITGGLGFLGSNLARRLVAVGARVTLLDNLSPACGGNTYNVSGIENRARVVFGDAREPDLMRRLVRGQDFLFNLAGSSSHLDSMREPFEDLRENCETSLAALEACRRENRSIRVVFSSTRQVYGRPQRLPVDESHPVAPVDINGVHKLAGEHYHQLYRRVHGVRSVILRLTNTIGPRMYVRDARQTFLGVWIRRLVEGEPFEVWGGRQLRDFTYVDDAVGALLKAGIDAPDVEGVYNLGGCEPVSLRELAERLVALKPGSAFVVRRYPASRKAIDIGDYHADGSKARAAFGWVPKVGLDDALRRTLAYYERHLPQYV